MGRPNLAVVYGVIMKKAFTLIELLVTISIIGILLAVISVAFSTAQKRSRDARRKGDLQALQKSIEQCYALSDSYPTTITGGSSLVCDSQTTMQLVPQEPKFGNDYTQVVLTTSSYQICTDLENDNLADDDSDADINDYCIYSQQ